jgi:hypothetical protein
MGATAGGAFGESELRAVAVWAAAGVGGDSEGGRCVCWGRKFNVPEVGGRRTNVAVRVGSGGGVSSRPSTAKHYCVVWRNNRRRRQHRRAGTRLGGGDWTAKRSLMDMRM